MQDIRFVSTRSLCSILNLSYWVFSLTIHPVAYMVFYSHHLIVFDIMLIVDVDELYHHIHYIGSVCNVHWCVCVDRQEVGVIW